jgi:hypothetical protein
MDQEWHLSSGNLLTVLVRIGKHSQKETLDGAFAFHDGKTLLYALVFCVVGYNVNITESEFVYFINTAF